MNKNTEKSKLAWIIVASLVIGLMIGYVWQFLFLGLVIYVFWLLKSIKDIRTWLVSGAGIEEAPAFSGEFASLVSSIVKLQNKQKLSKNLYQKSIIRFNEVLRSFPYPIVIIDADNKINWVGKRAAKILKLKRKKDVGIKIDNIVRNLELQEKLINPEPSEVQISAPIDEKIILSVAISKVSKNIRILSISDISKNKNLENIRKQFIANASHELRTPLTIISGYLQILNQDKTLDNYNKTMVDNAYEHAKLMGILIEDLLTLSNLEANGFRNNKSIVINMENVISKVANNLYANKNFRERLEFNIDNSLQVYGVYTQIYSIVFNLSENALKYSKEKVSVSWQLKDNLAILRVVDQGVGLIESEKIKVIEPFYRAIKTQTTQGSGLGLSIVNQAATNNNAKLYIENNNKQGLIFRVEFEKFISL